MKGALGELETAIFQRTILLSLIETAAGKSARMSDNGWLLTLGAPQIGMLMAVTNGKQARRLGALAQRLHSEVAALNGQLYALRALESREKEAGRAALD